MRIHLIAILLLTASPLLSQNDASVFKPGYDAINAGQFDQALKVFRDLNKKQNDRCAECYIGMALTHRKMGDLFAAAGEAQKAIERTDDSKVRARARLLKANALRDLGGAKNLLAAEDEYRRLLQDHPGLLSARVGLGMVLLKQNRDPDGITELQAVVAAAPADDPDLPFVRRLLANPRLARENYAPEFHITSMQGQNISLEALAGKLVVLDFWATWCAPCRESIPELRELHAKYGGRIAVISISSDQDENKWREFVTAKQMDWPQYFDRDHEIVRLFGVRGFPTYLVIDGEGIIRERITGMNPQQTVAYRLKPLVQKLAPK